MSLLSAETFIYSTLTASVSLQALIGQRVYSGVAPQDALYPCVIMSQSGGQFLPKHSGTQVLSDSILVKAVDKSGSYKTGEDIMTLVRSLLQGATGTGVIRCLEQNAVKYFAVESGEIYHMVGITWKVFVA
jgi:hypothetical protein